MNEIKTAFSKRKFWDSRKITLFLLASISVVFLAVFAYLPMFGVILAFKDGDYQLSILDAILETPWVGFENFTNFCRDPDFLRVIKNTLQINLLMLVINFPIPIIFALLINEVRHQRYKKCVQTITNFPHFISWIIFGGIVIAVTDRSTGIINPILEFFRLSDPENPVNLMDAEYFIAIIIITSIIKGTGWGSIIYLAAIAGVDVMLYEAAELDGATRFQKAWHITLPAIAPTITVFLLLRISDLLSNSFDQFYALQNVNNMEVSEVIATFSYKMGISQRRYSYSSALGLFNSVISFILLLGSNFISKKLTDRGIF